MPALIDSWLRTKLQKYSPKTQEEYRRMATFIRSEFDEDWRVEDVEPKDVARFLDKHFESKPNASNKYRALMSVMFTFAVRKGLRNNNPVSEVAGASEGKRDRYISDEELAAVRAAAMLGADGKPTPSGRTIVALIDLAYQTGQRIGDLLALNWSDVTHEGILFHPSKTVNSSGVRMLVELTPDLQATLESAKSGKVKAIGPVICTQSGGRFTYSGAQTAWKRACQRARKSYEVDCQKAGQEPDKRFLMGMHFHDIRAKALTDKRRQDGEEAAQALGGHTTADMTAQYIKAREVERVSPVRMRQST
ncbi:tyrosine-type recombinase/integrase [Cupriavidus sp. AU9028]|uniref:tyrosine-type recombinase/integrase n=1 Tax=Cupriavidus sp. AU9028 TaxID=2871157 RepID=UPI002103BC28|nr:tyrosine-type recombinase/integrase [Cupriavidus sp. AU9028]